MLLDILICMVLIPQMTQTYYSFDGFLDINNPVQEVIANDTGPQRIYTDLLDVVITAESAIAVDGQTGKIIYSKNSQEQRSIASITKLMTALVFLDNNPGWQTEVTVKASDRRNGGIVHLNTDEVITSRNLFYTSLIPSDNSATASLARITGFSEYEFVGQMNKKAQEFGLKNTKFSDPTGLNNNNLSTAEDLVKLINIALDKEDIALATTKYYYEFYVQSETIRRLVRLTNTDKLLNSYLNVLGGKTGHITVAGYCLGVKIKGEDSQEILIVVLGSDTNYDRFQDIKAISDFVFTNYKWE